MRMDDNTNKSSSSSDRKSHSLFAIPAPLRVLFDLFPRVTYVPNDIPLRPYWALRADPNKLFVWTTIDGAVRNAASFNPACLKWQVYLTFKKLPICTVFSNNHASPTGQLPFLVPGRKDREAAEPRFSGAVVTTADLQKLSKGDITESHSKLREDAYMSLIDGPIRSAWLFHMYLTPNFERFTVPCYIDSQSSSSVVRAVSTFELRKAAETELLKHSSTINQQALYDEAREAFQALNEYCLERSSQYSEKEATLLDAALFSYTDLLWSIEYKCWADSGLVDILLSNGSILDSYDALDTKYNWWRVPLPERYITLERQLPSINESLDLKLRRPGCAQARRSL